MNRVMAVNEWQMVVWMRAGIRLLATILAVTLGAINRKTTYGKTKWAQTESKQQMESISSVLDQMINQGMDLQKEEILKMIWEKINGGE